MVSDLILFPAPSPISAALYAPTPKAAQRVLEFFTAQINNDPTSPSYLTQVLDGVYANPDPRTYPLSSYSYMIIPTALQAPLTSDKGYTLGKFAYYFLCEGQQAMGDLGYSPLPINLVQAAVAQVAKIPGVDVQSLDLSKCNNPTFDPSGKNLLAEQAQQPQSCDKLSVTMCPDPTGGAKTPTYVAAAAPGATTTTTPPAAGRTTKPTKGTKKPNPATTKAVGVRPTITGSGPAPTSTPPPGANVTTAPGAAPGVKPTATGTAGPAPVQATVSGPAPAVVATDPIGDGAAPAAQAPASGGAGVAGNPAPGNGATVGAAPAVIRAVPVSLAVSSGWSFQDTLMVLAVLLLALVVVGPPLISRRLTRRAR